MEGVIIVPLHIGFIENNQTEAWRGAIYASGSGTKVLTFNYVVRADDVDLSGVMIRYTSASYGFDGPGTVKSKETGLLIKDSWAGTGHLPEHRVDGRPYVTEARLVSSPVDGEAYRLGEKIRLQMTFSEPMDVVVRGNDATLSAGLYVGFVDRNWSEAWRPAIYEDGAGTSTFTFAYSVKATDVDNEGVRIVPGNDTTAGLTGGGNIVSVADSTPSSEWYEGSWHLTGHKVNGRPSVGGGTAFDLDDANDGAWDVWVGMGMVLVVDQGEDKIFAYDDGGRREPSRDIGLDQSGGDGAPEAGTTPTGIWSDGETVWVAFQDVENIFAYDLADGTRNADREIPLEGTGLAGRGEYFEGEYVSLGIWSDGTTMWVMNSTPFKILAFDLESKTYDSGKTFTPPHPAGAPYSGGEVTDLWSDGTTVWLADSAEGKLYAHRLNDGSQDSDKDISVTLPQSQNGISGLTVSGNHMWVVSSDSDDTTFNLTKYNVPSLIDSSPFLSGVRVVSTPKDGETYTEGELIEIEVTFSHSVRLFGRYDPNLLLMVGDPRLVDPVREARLARSEGDTYDDHTSKLKFIYWVQD